MNPSVLVVDDETKPRTVLRRFLASAGCNVREADCATGALELMKFAPADVVFSDVRMPFRDGIWLVEELRREWPNTLVVITSGADDYPTIMAARKNGVIDYLLKPFGREAVIQALARAVEKIEAAKQTTP